jgi:trimeric autotransporter adhesin
MKHFLFSVGFLLSAFWGMAQAVTISAAGTVTSPTNPNVIFSVQSGTQGIQFPMMSSTARLSMGQSTGMAGGGLSLVGIVVFDTTTKTIYYNNGATWINVSAPGESWLTTGNAGTVGGGINFIGTTDNVPLYFRVNNLQSGLIDQINANAFFGYQAGIQNTGIGNTALGFEALSANTTADNNTAIGGAALNLNTTGFDNTALGALSLASNTTGSGNTTNGFVTLQSNTTGSNNTAMGEQALPENTTGGGNTAIGAGALLENNTGFSNVAVGYASLSTNRTGNRNVAIGDSALFSNSGNDNSAFGAGALYSNKTGQNLTAIGAGADVSADGLSDATAIGAGAAVGASFTIQLGDNNVTAVNSFGTFNTISDGRFKFNIREDVRGLDFILKLRPVTYQLDTRKIANELGGGNAGVGGNTLASFAAANPDSRAMSIRRTGFIAQEVEKAADSTGFDFDGIKKPQSDKDHYSLSYEEFVVPLVKAVQEQQKEIKDQQKEIEEQRKEIEDLKKLVVEISKK